MERRKLSRGRCQPEGVARRARSLDLYKIIYKWMVSDGESKAFSSVEDNYDGIKVKKLGAPPINLKATAKSKLTDGKTVGGRGHLTEEKIKKIERYLLLMG